jgi:hypothetical protein
MVCSDSSKYWIYVSKKELGNGIAQLKIGMKHQSTKDQFQRAREGARYGYDTVAEFPSSISDGLVRELLRQENLLTGCNLFRSVKRNNKSRSLSEMIDVNSSDVELICSKVSEICGYTPVANVPGCTLRPEQQGCIDAILKSFSCQDDSRTKEFLCACKPRFGKTITMLKCIMALGVRTTLILSYRPTDVSLSWLGDYKKVSADYEVKCIDDVSEADLLDTDKRLVVFASYQDFDLSKLKFSKLIDAGIDFLIENRRKTPSSAALRQEGDVSLNSKSFSFYHHLFLAP